VAQYRRKVAKSCKACGADRPVSEAPDPCLGTLPGIRFACCGHGQREGQCYLVYEDGRKVYGEDARQEQIAMGGNPAPLQDANAPYDSGWEQK
jgi:hypothetical protein